ncbi:MAG: hypothetical protein IJD04_07775, partial [Desulfovibrionaceae bacterium]|nr:hypothetical protein [Desulfovibrionaceae bacterium]
MAELYWQHPELKLLARAELARILGSRDFYAPRRFSDFLTYLVEETLAGRGGELKAYNIGVEVFRRPADFDPQSDSVVRVEAAKLRNRLENYYRNNKPVGVEILVPKGHYSVIFRCTPEMEATEQPKEAAAESNELSVAKTLPHADEKQGCAAEATFPSVQAKACSIAIFPFLNIGGGQQATHLVSGIVEELIIGLTRFHDLMVINVNFSPEAQSGNADMAALTRQLGARFYLYGNIQVLDGSMRIRAILVDSQTRCSIWAEKFDSVFVPANLFD